MRVLYWTESFWPRIGGSEVAAGVLLDHLRRRGHAFEVVTRQWSSDQPAIDEWRAMPVHRVPFDDSTLARRDPHELLRLRQRIVAIKRRFRPDLVHIGLTGPSLFLHQFTAAQLPAPTLVTLHVAPTETEYGTNQPVHETLWKANWVAPVSLALAQQIKRRVPELADRCSVIYNALPDPAIELSPAPLEPPTLLCVGRVTQQKGFDTVVSAMPLVRQTFPGARLVIAGDGDASDSLRELARRLGVEDCVHMLGWTPPEDVPALIDSATLVLVPSRWEPFGLVALQAAQRGRVCLAARVDGLPEVVQHERTGLLLQSDQPRRWAEAIGDILGDRCRITAMGREAAQFVRQRFSLEDHVDAYDSLYARVAAGGDRREAIA